MTAGSVHSLGTALVVLALVAAAVAAVGGALAEARREKAATRRLRVALGTGRPRRSPRRALRRLRGPLRDWGPPVAAGLGAATLISGVLGGLVGVLTALGVRRSLRGRQNATESSEADEEPDPSELPLCADLMAACLAAGASPGEAAGAVGRSLAGPLGTALIRVRAELRLGGDPAECWQRFGRLPTAREMGRCLARASTTGSAPVAEMSRLAADYRAAYARSALARARRAAVHATAPLGVCFLPAFLLVGVAPVVMGLAGTVLGRTG
ncbi:type II secretion system F family protein [Streptomyces sp. NPDC093221]|uniref:type II secretion system F family protein n=1 Tax=Streptomyces sp. NPDC093221 TaxID=3366032 RepID=UPI003806B06F